MDVLKETNFPRIESAARCGLHSAFACPVKIGEHTLGVVEFFTTRFQEPDADSVEMLVTIAGNVGQFLERTEAEERVRRSQARLEHVVASSPAVLYSLASDGGDLTPTWISPNITDLLGYTPEEALSPTWWNESIHPEDRDRTMRSVADGLNSQDRIVIDYRIQRRDRSYVWLRGEMRFLRDGDGKQLEILGSWTDITTRVEAEQALAERARTSSLSAEIGQSLTESRDVRQTLRDCAESVVRHLDAAFARIWTVDSTGTVLELQASAGMYSHLDGPHSRVPVGTLKIGLIASERRPHLTNSVIGDPRVADQEWASREGMVAFAGYPLIVEDRLVGVLALFARHPLPEATLDALGRVAGSIAIGIERKRAEESLQTANSLLEDAISDLHLAQSKIVEQVRLRALGEMASGIAHDFNNALSPIIGFSDLLLEHPANLDDRETLTSYLQTIRTAAIDAASVVRRLREFYRRRDETDVLTAVDLNAIVRQSIEISKPRWRDQSQARGATIEVSADLAKIPMVAGDASHLREAIMNLIFNAVDAMPEGGQVRLRTFPSEAGGATLEVSDTGCGMSDEVRQRCLQPFYTTKGDRGTGLGLSIVYGIIQRHEGTLDIRSTIGDGAAVTITLPHYRGDVTVATIKKAVSEIPSLRVLVVDDEVQVREAAAAMLAADGHHVVAAADGAEALTLMQENAFDLVVTDRAMPGMSGDKLADSVRASYPSVRVMMLTGFGDLMHTIGESPPGVHLVVAKPVTVPILREAVRKVMAQA